MLKEISIMRPILIVFVVVFHAFIIYGGGWMPPIGYKDVPLYEHIAGWTYSFMLESFTFISGFIYFYTTSINGVGSFGSLVFKKCKRLLLPMLLFGIVYFFLFCSYESFLCFLYDVISGVGHLWYLEMLFWCFVESWIIKQIKLDKRLMLGIIAFLAIFCSWLPLPLQIGKSFYYLLFFYLPVFIVDKRDNILIFVKRYQIRVLIISWLCYIFAFAFIFYELHYPRFIDNLSLFDKAIVIILNHVFQIIYSMLGVVAFYLTCLMVAGTTEMMNNKSQLVVIGKYCFGVYVFQQFILKGLYYLTPIPDFVGPVLLPWVGVITAILFSLLLTYMLHLVRIGKVLL